MTHARVRERVNGSPAERRWQYAITAVFATSGFALASWFSRVPSVRDDLHASTAQMSVRISLAAVDGHGFTNTAGAYVYGGLVAAMTVGRLAGSRVLDRYGRAPVLASLAMVGIVGVTLVVLGTGSTVVVTGTLLWGLGLSLGFPVCISAAADHPTHAARRVSAVSICGYSTFLVGPPAIGFLGEHAGILNALWLVAAALALALLCTPAVRPPGTKEGVA